MEEVLGPGNTSAQQWDSWQAVFGQRGEDGRPAALYDAGTGAIDQRIAEEYRAYDIAGRVRRDPGLAGHFYQRIRLYVGDADNFYLNEAVALLKEEVEGVQFLHFPEGQHGFMKILPGYDHGSIFGAPEVRQIPADMLAHLRRAVFLGVQAHPFQHCAGLHVEDTCDLAHRHAITIEEDHQ